MQSRFWFHCRAGPALSFKDPRESLLFLFQVFGTGQNSFITGFNDWKHTSEYIGSHERSSNHCSSIRIFLQGSTKKDRTDAKFLEVFESEFKYMKNVPKGC